MAHDIHTIWSELNEDLERYICAKVNHQDHCNDILQDVYLKMTENVEKIKNVENLKAYLLKISANTIADHYRHHKVASDIVDIQQPEISENDCCPSPAISERFLQKAIGELPEKYRDALIKTDLQGMSQKEYADSLGISLSGAKSRVQRAREKLKDIVLKCCDYQFDKYGNVVKCCGEDIDGAASN